MLNPLGLGSNEVFLGSSGAAVKILQSLSNIAGIYDGHGSVNSLQTMSGVNLANYSYGPFGEAAAGANNAGSFYGYSGERYEPMTSLQFLRARYYSPDIGRFTAADTYPRQLINPLSMNK